LKLSMVTSGSRRLSGKECVINLVITQCNSTALCSFIRSFIHLLSRRFGVHAFEIIKAVQRSKKGFMQHIPPPLEERSFCCRCLWMMLLLLHRPVRLWRLYFAVGYVYEANPSPVKFSINVSTVGCYVNRRNVTFLWPIFIVVIIIIRKFKLCWFHELNCIG